MKTEEFIREKILAWYAENGRTLPWREYPDPYRVWLSEVILQQTRVAQGLDYFNRFVSRFPDVGALARAEETEVLRLWQGLGYYSRARNLHAASRQIAGTYGGRFPETYEQVRSLKGVGDYTAAAVCSIAYGQPYAVVDGNVYRVLSRLFALGLPIDTGAGKRAFSALAEKLLDRRRPGVYNQALMDFGALQCVPRSPDCPACPLAGVCMAFRTGEVARYPVKEGKQKSRDRYFNYLHIRCGGRTLLSQRKGKDIWRELYEFPLIETVQPADWEALLKDPAFPALFAGIPLLRLAGTVAMPRHTLSHQVIHAVFYTVEVPAFTSGMEEFLIVPETELDRYPISRLTELYLEK